MHVPIVERERGSATFLVNDNLQREDSRFFQLLDDHMVGGSNFETNELNVS